MGAVGGVDCGVVGAGLGGLTRVGEVEGGESRSGVQE